MGSQNKRSFYFFRHGETDWNKDRRCQGHTDIPLNEAGREQAKKLAVLLRQFNLRHIYSSDLSRAYETAEIVAAGAIPISKMGSLREGFFGEGEGLYLKEIEEKFTGRLDLFGQGLTEETRNSPIFPGAETPMEVVKRIQDSLGIIMKESSEENIGISTHGAALRNFIQDISGPNSKPVQIPNCVAFKVIYYPDSNVWDVTGPLS